MANRSGTRAMPPRRSVVHSNDVVGRYGVMPGQVVEGESTEEAAAVEGKSPARGAGRRRGGKRAKIDADGYDL
eukprot:34589-Eustigmatos_ZCMA.PRE.1